MHRFIPMCLDAAIAAVFLVPLFWYLNKHYFHSSGRMACYIVLAVYLSGMFAVVGLPNIRYVRFDPNFNFMPFQYMFSDYETSLLNVALFMPLGFFLPVFWLEYKKFWKTMVFGFSVSLFIEILQIFTYRASDVNDLITNTFGTILGWLIARLLLRFVPKIVPSDHTQDVSITCTASFGVMFFVQPFLANWLLPLFGY